MESTEARTAPIEVAQQVLSAQPFSVLVGARLTAFEPGTATLEMDIEDHHRQQYGLVHGGVLSYAADNVLTFAAATVLGPSVITAGMTIDYLRGARAGTLRASAHVVHHTARHAVCQVDVVVTGPGGDERVCAVAQGTAIVTDGGTGMSRGTS